MNKLQGSFTRVVPRDSIALVDWLRWHTVLLGRLFIFETEREDWRMTELRYRQKLSLVDFMSIYWLTGKHKIDRIPILEASFDYMWRIY